MKVDYLACTEVGYEEVKRSSSLTRRGWTSRDVRSKHTMIMWLLDVHCIVSLTLMATVMGNEGVQADSLMGKNANAKNRTFMLS